MPRTTITRALNLMGYKADDAASGPEALSKLAARYYDLMLIDLRMPGMDGIEVMRQTSQLCPDTLVIVLTAYATLESAIAAVRLGAADYLLKPYSLRDTEAAIARALEKSRPLFEGLPNSDERLLRRGTVTLDIEKRLAMVSLPDGGVRQAELTGVESALLMFLLQSPGIVHSCRALARAPLGYEVGEREAEDIVRPHISRLRNKIEVDPAHPVLIQTVRGRGYFFPGEGDAIK
jgi:two-component system, OmpR family, alkaline phosphatase synthesis response regulator PhoP